MWCRAAIADTVLPVGDALDTLLPTAIYLTVVSLLDDALAESVQTKCGSASTKDLYSRIHALKTGGHLKDATGLHRIRILRNQLAHDSGRYASWPEVDELFRVVEGELQHLGLSAGGSQRASGAFG
jgi:hypothetical protein